MHTYCQHPRLTIARRVLLNLSLSCSVYCFLLSSLFWKVRSLDTTLFHKALLGSLAALLGEEDSL